MRQVRAFTAAFAITLCVLGLGVGLFTVGYNSKRVTHGENTPSASYKLQNGQLTLSDAQGNAVTLAVVEEQQTVAPLMPAPARVSLKLLRGVSFLAEKLADRLG